MRWTGAAWRGAVVLHEGLHAFGCVSPGCAWPVS